MTSRALYLPTRGQLHILAGHVKGLVEAGESVIVVTVHHPAATLRAQFDRDGINAAMVSIIDAVGHGPGAREPEAFTHFVASPTLLEAIGMRLRKLVASRSDPHVIVIDCDALAFHNPGRVVEEFLRSIVDQIAQEVPVDVVMTEPSRLDAGLKQFLHGFLPDELHLGSAWA